MTAAKKDGFMVQAGILAAAGILSRIIGLLYNSPMTAIIGDEGNGYYEFAYRAYTIVLLISTYSIPAAISKVIASRLAVGEYRNAHRIFKGAVYYALIVGGVAALLVFIFADYLVNLTGAATVLRFFAPTIFLSGILGVLRGYFQAHRTMAQTSISQILEQITNALVSILLAIWFVGMVPDLETTRRSIYGAAGGAIGTGFGVVMGLLFMWAIYLLNKKTIAARIEKDRGHEDLSYQMIFKMILLVVTPFILSTFVYNINAYINQTLFIFVGRLRELSEVEMATLNSAIGKATKIATIPIAIAAALSTAIIPGIAGDFTLNRLDECREKVAKAVRGAMFVAIPAAVGIAVLSRPMMLFLYPQEATLDLSVNLLMIMSLGVIFFSLATLSAAVLQGTGKINSPVINASAALGVQTVVLAALLVYTEIGVYAMAMTTVLFAILTCLMNGYSVFHHLEYSHEWQRTFIKPLLIAIVMGLVTYGSYSGMYALTSINLVALSSAVITGVIVYFVLAVKWQVLMATELRWLKRGKLLTGWVNELEAKEKQGNQ
ncbi:MAG: polysaccharide biosynthesis protein [Lachnospiraceae bacterium]|jgi:stage V sporulation protein B|nr:polysaccharide biosynthesis protein [Lachnospiraceae bacterium]